MSSSGGSSSSGRVLIEQIVLSVATASVSFSQIPQNYAHLEVEALARTLTVAETDTWVIFFNGSASANFDELEVVTNNNLLTGYAAANQGSLGADLYLPGTSATAGVWGRLHMWIPFYTNTNYDRVCHLDGGMVDGVNIATGGYGFTCEALHRSTAALSAIELSNLGVGDLAIGSIFNLYGVT